MARVSVGSRTRPETLPPLFHLQACVKRAAIFSAVVMQKHVVQKLEGVVDEARAARGRG